MSTIRIRAAVRCVARIAIAAGAMARAAQAQATLLESRANTPHFNPVTPALATSASEDCDPYWTRMERVDDIFLPIVTFGMGDTQDEALQKAHDLIAITLATKVSAFVHGEAGVIKALTVDVQAFGAGTFVEKNKSIFCRVDGRWKVWIRTYVFVSAYWRAVTEANPRLKNPDFDLMATIREEMRRHPTPTSGSLLWKSLYAPGAVQRASGHETWGGVILGAVVTGGSVGIGGLIGTNIASSQARAETTSPARKDYYTNQSNVWSRAGQVGWMVAGAFYVIGAVDGISTNPESVAAWRIFNHTMLRVGVRR